MTAFDTGILLHNPTPTLAPRARENACANWSLWSRRQPHHRCTVALPADAPRRLALLRAQTRLKLPDCCVVLAAEQEQAALATFDQRLAAAARTRGLMLHGSG